MSTRFLYHGFGIVGYDYIRTDYRQEDLIFTVARKKFSLRCPKCKSKKVIRRGWLPRRFHALPIGRKAIYIKTDVHRVECKACHIVRQAPIGFAHPRMTYTRTLERYVLELAKFMVHPTKAYFAS